MELLSQIQNVSPEHLKDFLLIVVASVAVGSNAISAFSSRRAQKREISMADSFVTTEFCGQKHDELERRVGNVEGQLIEIRHEMKADRIALEASDESRASRIHIRLDDMERDLNQKIQELPDRVIVFLNNTKVIK